MLPPFPPSSWSFLSKVSNAIIFLQLIRLLWALHPLSTVEHNCMYPSSQLIYIKMLLIGNILSPTESLHCSLPTESFHCSVPTESLHSFSPPRKPTLQSNIALWFRGRLWSVVALGFHPSWVTCGFIAQWPWFEQVTSPLLGPCFLSYNMGIKIAPTLWD